ISFWRFQRFRRGPRTLSVARMPGYMTVSLWEPLTLHEPAPPHRPASGPYGSWVARVCRQPRLVVLLCLAAAAVLAWTAATTLTINTSTNDMLSEELPFRQQNEAVDAAFPQLVDTLIIAVEGPGALAADAAAEQL